MHSCSSTVTSSTRSMNSKGPSALSVEQNSVSDAPDTIVLEAGRLERHYWNDLWRHRELLFFLAWRDVLVQYKQTTIGFAWAILRPLTTMIVFTLVFGRIANLPSGSVPYAVLVFSGLLPWQFFSTVFTNMANSLIGNSAMVSKVYFPRMIIPLAVIGVGIVDFVVASGIFAVLVAWYGYWPDWRVATLPLFILLGLVAVIGPGMLLASLNVEYRDFRYVVPFIVQFGLFISPVGFATSVIPDRYRLLYSLNPMVGVIEGFRWALLRGDAGLSVTAVLASVFISFALLVLGIRFFRRTEQGFADVI